LVNLININRRNIVIKKMLFIVSLVFAFLSAPALLADVTQVNYGVSAPASYQSMPDIKACEACHSVSEQNTQLRQKTIDTTEYIPRSSLNYGDGGSEGLSTAMIAGSAHYFEVGWRK